MLVAVPCFIGATAAGMAVASGDSAVTTVIGALVAGLVGGLIGGLVAWLLGRRQASYVREQVQHGGIPLWVRTTDTAQEEKACEILRNASTQDVHVHDQPGAESRSINWDLLYGYLDWPARVPRSLKRGGA